jgi:hypothetical protein
MAQIRLDKETLTEELNAMGIKKTERMVSVTDDWHPCYPGNQVRLKLSLNYYHGYYVILSAWGMDDLGVIIEKTADNYAEALGQYVALEDLYHSVPDGVDRRWFFQHGFQYF